MSEESATGQHTVAAPADPVSERPTRLEQARVVADQEYRLSLRNRWAYALTVVLAVLAVAITALGRSRVGPAGLDATVVSLASLVTYVVPLAALAFGYDTVVAAAEDGRLGTLFALPVPRWTVVLGAFLGRAVTLAGATVIGLGVAAVPLTLEHGTGHWTAYLGLVGGAIGLGLAFLAIAVLVSTVAREKAHALGLVLATWFWFVLAHDIVALGAIATLPVPGGAVTAVVLANPVDVFRVLVLQVVEASGSGFAAVYATAGIPTAGLALTLLAWCVAPALAAAYTIRRRSI